MWNDDLIVEELRQIREEHAAQFNYDIRAIVESLQQEEAQSGCRLVSFSRQTREDTPDLLSNHPQSSKSDFC